MIAKCIALLAVVAQINAYVCNSGAVGTVGTVGTIGGVGSVGTVGAVVGSGIGASGNTRNVVARGKYPVALENTGPVPDPRVPVTTSHVQAPVQQKPTVRLSANIPAPKTVAHSCTCYKTILRPRVHDQVISVPTVQRYIETTHTPVVENIHYEAYPVNSPDNLVSGGVQLVSAGSVGSPISTVSSVGSVAVSPVSSVGTVGTVGTGSVVVPYSSGCVRSGYYY